MKIFNLIVLFIFFTTYANAQMFIFGHRGACGYEPENTLPSFARAIDLGVAMVELDVYVCATGELVVTHDDDLSITTDGHGKVVDMSLQELRKLKVKGTGVIPTLQEVIELVHRRIPINIELKGPGVAKPVADLLKKYFKKGWDETDFVISSFDHDQLVEFKALCPDIKIGILFSFKKLLLFPDDSIVKLAAQYQADFIGLDLRSVTKNLIDLAHEAKYPVCVWTVNDKKTADEMRSLHVDGIFSNYPDLVG